MKKFFQNLALVLVSLIIILGLLEIGVRFLNRNLGRYPKKDPILHHALVPNAVLERNKKEFQVTYRINSLGLRDHEISPEKPQNTFRILMLGDSYTFGIGSDLEDTFVKRLEKKLNSRGRSQKIEVVNGGISSYSPILEYLFLVHKGLSLNPDLVVLNYDISDVQDDYKYSQIAEFDSGGKPLRVKPIEVQFYFQELKKGFQSKIPYLQNSALYQFVAERYYQLIGKRDAPQYYQKAKFIAGDIEYDRDLPMRENIPDWKNHFDRSAGYLKLISELLRSKNIPLVITSYPYGTLISEQEWKIGRELRGFDPKVYQSDLFAYLEAFTRNERIPFLNMTPHFLASGDFPLFYPYDGHFTPAGHEVAATALEQFVLQENLVPTQPRGLSRK